ncbi:MAG: ABC transporter ATP-binding protein [Acidimicrobiia bacterium]|nr:ABC transporter ATP-binding protein [Acidimicrobiia bacterium]
MAGTGKAHLRPEGEALLRVEDLVVEFRIGRTGLKVNAVSGISFDVLRGETLGIVGESGCGKSTTGRAIMQLPRATSGSVVFDGRELTTLDKEEMREVRTKVQMIFQDPISSLNPRDEPVSALDVSVQAQVINLLEELKKAHGLTLIFIAHDLAVVKNISDRVAVMYLGKICEIGPSDGLYTKPAHPYTKLLLDSIPVPDPNVETRKVVIEGEPPSPVNPPTGCRFNPRCPSASDRCRSEEPTMREIEPGHFVACHHPLFGGDAPVTVRTD